MAQHNLLPRVGLAALLAGAMSTPQSATAELELPKPSPEARVMQTVGLTEIEVEYSSPARRGRAIWGELVPYGEHWRTGANANTRIRFSRPVKIGGTEVAAGTYSLHSFPGEKTWTWVVNRKTNGWGSSTYDESQDVLRMEVVPAKGPELERMRFVFEETTLSGTRLRLQWAGLSVTMPIEVMTEAQVDAGVDDAMAGLWREPAAAARYFVDQGEQLDRALELVDQSIAIRETWYNLWVKARILHRLDRDGETRPLVEKALSMGDDSGAFAFYSQQMKAALESWAK